MSETAAMETQAPTGATLRVSQIVVNLVLLNEHDAPVTPDAIAFAGNETGTAAEQLAAWLGGLSAQLEAASDA